MTYYLCKHLGSNALVFLLQLLWAAMRVLQNVLIMGVFGAIIDLNFREFMLWLLLYLAACGMDCLLDCLRSWAKARAIRTMNNHIRADMTATLCSMPHQVYHAQPSGEYLSRFTNDINRIESLAWTSFYGIISLGAQIIFSAIVLAGLHWSLIAVSVAAALIMLLIPRLVGRRVEQLSDICAKEQALATAAFQDLLAGLDVLRAFGRTDRFVEQSAEASEGMEKPRYRLICRQTFTEDGIALIGASMQILVLALSGLLAIRGVILQSAFSGAGNVCGTVCNGLTQIGQLVLAIRASRPYFAAITVHADKRCAEPSTPMPPLQDAITLEGLSFGYDGHPVLRDVDLRFEKGGKYALTGASGCGKSTLLKLMMGWLPGYHGTIRFDGIDARELTDDQLRQQMSYIGQDVFLFNTTIRDNITLGDRFSSEEIAQALQSSALDADLAQMPHGLETAVGENGSSLSGGQKQRVAIARALLHKRSILLLDEGTSALDRENATIVEESLLGNRDLTLILVSHHLPDERKAKFTRVFSLAQSA